MYLTLSEVLARVPYSKASLYRKIKAGDFPGQIRVGPQKVVWRKADVDAWWRKWMPEVSEHQTLEEIF